MISPGSWVLHQEGDMRAVLEVDGRTAYVYLWDPDRGVLSHVWLYNCEPEGSLDIAESCDDAPVMRQEDIRDDLYRVPTSLTEIGCVYDRNSTNWTVLFGDQSIANLRSGNRPGSSIFAKFPTELAVPWDQQ